MPAGELRHRIQITSRDVTGQNSFGEDIITNSEVGTFWARVETLSGRELDTLAQRWAEARYRITLRHQPGVVFRRDQTITWDGQTFDVLDVQADNRQRWVVLICRDHVD